MDSNCRMRDTSATKRTTSTARAGSIAILKSTL